MNKDNANKYLPLVQALSDGKLIQARTSFNGNWEDLEDVMLLLPPENYRIKPEPREIWVRRYEGSEVNGTYAHSSKAEAEHECPAGWAAIRYREVIE